MPKLIYILILFTSNYFLTAAGIVQQADSLRYHKKYHEALQLYGTLEQKDSTDLIYMAICYMELENYDSSMMYFNKANKICKGDEFKAYILLNKSHLLSKRGEYLSAIRISKQAIKLNISGHIRTYIYINYASYLYEYCKFKDAINVYDSILNFMEVEKENYGYIYQTLGDCYFELEDYASALKNYTICLDYINTSFQNKNYALLYFSLCDTYIKLGDIKKAEMYINKAINYCAADKENRYADLVKAYNKQAQLCLHKGEPGKALELSGSVLNARVSRKDFIGIYTTRGDIYRALDRPDSCLFYYQAAVDALQGTWRSFTSQKDKIAFNKTRNNLYDKIIQYSVKIYLDTKDTLYLDKSFEFIERSRYAVLFSEMEITGSIISLNGTQELMQDGEVFLVYQLLDSMLFSMCISKDTIAVNAFIPDTAFDYHVKDLIRSMRHNFLPDPDDEYYAFTGSSFYLYTKLVKPYEHEIKDKKVRISANSLLEFIPFDILITAIPSLKPHGSYNDRNYTLLPYLLYNNVITYTENISLYFAVYPHANSKKKLGIFSPDYRSVPGLTTLKFNRMLSRRLSKRYMCDLYQDSVATKSNFIRVAGNYRVLFMATHGQTGEDEDSNRLAFYPDSNYYLYQDEIYNMHLHPDLVILLSCYANAGDLVEGEGILSITRAFRKAGVKSVIASRWLNSDAEFAFIADRFFRYLSRGYWSDEALNKATQKIIGVYEPGIGWHPAYWSNNVLMGQPGRIRLVNRIWLIVIITALAAAVITVYLIRARRNDHHRET